MFDSERPIFVQLADNVAESITGGSFPEGTAVPSTNELAAFHHINPATAGKALRFLAERGILEKRRGIGMFVAIGARERLLSERRIEFQEQYVIPLLREARSINLTTEDVHRALDDAANAMAATTPIDPAPHLKEHS